MMKVNNRGSSNVLLIVLAAAVIIAALFFFLPIGGVVGECRESAISFLLRKPPRFLSLEVKLNDEPRIINAGESLRILGNENLIITKINANTFFKRYLSADIEGFGKQNELNVPVSTSEIKKQLMDAGIRSLPIDIYYISHVIAKVPIVVEYTADDFLSKLKKTRNQNEQSSILKNALSLFPEDMRFFNQLEDIYNKAGDYAGLITIYKTFLEKNENNETVLLKLTNAYIRAGLLDDAEKLNLNIIENNRQTPSTYLRLAMTADARSDINKKISYLEDGLLMDRYNDDILLQLGKAYEEKGDKIKAMEFFKSISQNTSSKEVLISVIQDAIKKQDYETAEPLLKRYISLYPNDKNAVALLGKVMGNMGDANAQIEYYKKALALSPKDTVVMFNLGIAYEKAGDDKEALRIYKQLLKLKPNDIDTISRIASLSNKQGQKSDAYRYYNQLSGTKATEENLKGLVTAASRLNDNQKTIEACRKYLSKYQDYDVALILANTLEKVANTKNGKVRAKYIKDAIDAYISANDIKQDDQVEQKIIDLSKERRLLLKDLR